MSNCPPPSKDLTTHPSDRAIVLPNVRCAYCGTPLGKLNATKDHVIGRNFVPRGKLSQQWNVIVRACQTCNNRKSDLEDDISAITMQPDAYGRFPIDDEALRGEAARKAAAISRRTGKQVGVSHERLEMQTPFMNSGTIKMEFTSPPQLDEDRAFELAAMQVNGVFHYLTFNRETRQGGYMLGGYLGVAVTRRSDWGNAINRTFMDHVVGWEPRFVGHGANGFFNIIVRRHPSLVCWSWGVEWNCSYRVIGLAGEPGDVDKATPAFPPLKVREFRTANGHTFRIRDDVPLPDEDDRMFYWPDMEAVMGTEPAP